MVDERRVEHRDAGNVLCSTAQTRTEVGMTRWGDAATTGGALRADAAAHAIEQCCALTLSTMLLAPNLRSVDTSYLALAEAEPVGAGSVQRAAAKESASRLQAKT